MRSRESVSTLNGVVLTGIPSVGQVPVASGPGTAGWGNPSTGIIADEIFNAEDDGFDSSSLDAKWAQQAIGTLPTIVINPIYARSRYLMKWAGGAIGGVKLEQVFTPAGDFALTCKVESHFRGAGNSLIDFYVLSNGDTDGAQARVVGTAAHTNFSATLFNITTSTPASAGSTGSLALTLPIYFHIQRVGTTFTMLWSRDGVTWVVVGTPFTKTVTITRFFFQIQNITTPLKEWMAIDWLRRDWFFF